MSHAPTATAHSDAHAHEHHAVSWQLLTGVFGILMLLTILTVAAIQVDLGSLNIVIALAIAVVKASLVVYVFMHLKWDRGFHALCLILSMAFVAIMIGYIFIDTGSYSGNIRAYELTQERATPGE